MRVGWAIFVFGLLIAAILFVVNFLRKRRNPEAIINEELSRSVIQLAPGQIPLWVAVSKVETDNFDSLLCRRYYNLFGMTVPNKRDSLRNGEIYMPGDDNEFSTYANFVDSVRDQIIWLVASGFDRNVFTLDGFIAEMKRVGYFQADAEAYKERMRDFL